MMRISRLDPEDPEGKLRRHYEISIDAPFTVLDCRATQANTALPQYSGPDPPTLHRQTSTCGCPDAEVTATSMSAVSSTGTLPMVESSNDSVDTVTNSVLPMPPQAAHVHTRSGRGAPGNAVTAAASGGGSPRSSSAAVSANPIWRVRNQDAAARPIHLMRIPSFDPPAFNADEPPPPLEAETPPPNYDVIVGTPSVDGLADYFARLADYEDPPSTAATGTPPARGEDEDGYGFGRALERHEAQEEEDDSDSADEHNQPARIMSRGGRVNVANPRTPGGRLVPSRSLDIERPVLSLNMAQAMRRG